MRDHPPEAEEQPFEFAAPTDETPSGAAHLTLVVVPYEDEVPVCEEQPGPDADLKIEMKTLLPRDVGARVVTPGEL